MTELKRYCIHYTLNGQPQTLLLEAFEEPALARVENAILLRHVQEPRAATDQPWEDPEVPSEQARLVELGVSDIHIERQL